MASHAASHGANEWLLPTAIFLPLLWLASEGTTPISFSYCAVGFAAPALESRNKSKRSIQEVGALLSIYFRLGPVAGQHIEINQGYETPY
jgi:hypothetical protein